MNKYKLTHLSNKELLRDMDQAVANQKQIRAQLMAHLKEVEARQLHRAQGYPSLVAYCVGELRMSEDLAEEILAERVHERREGEDTRELGPGGSTGAE